MHAQRSRMWRGLRPMPVDGWQLGDHAPAFASYSWYLPTIASSKSTATSYLPNLLPASSKKKSRENGKSEAEERWVGVRRLRKRCVVSRQHEQSVGYAYPEYTRAGTWDKYKNKYQNKTKLHPERCCRGGNRKWQARSAHAREHFITYSFTTLSWSAASSASCTGTRTGVSPSAEPIGSAGSADECCTASGDASGSA